MAQNQHSLEYYVANRYLYDLNNSGYQPEFLNDEAALDDALKIMAALNQASQFIKRSVSDRRATT